MRWQRDINRRVGLLPQFIIQIIFTDGLFSGIVGVGSQARNCRSRWRMSRCSFAYGVSVLYTR